MTFNGFVGKQQTISVLRWEPNSYLIKLMEVLDWVLSQIKMADRGVGLQCVSSVMIKSVGVRGRGWSHFWGAVMWNVEQQKKKNLLT